MVVKISSKGHQMVLTKSSKVSYQKNSNVPQEVIKRSWKVIQCSESIRSSGLQKVLKRSTKSSKSQGNAQILPKVLRPQGFKWSTKGPQIRQMVLKALGVLKGPQKVFKTTSKSSKRYQCPENPLVVKSSSKSHQMVLTKSSKVPKKSPQKVHKKSSKDPEKFSNVLRSSGPQIFKKSSKAQQSPQKVKEMHKMYPRSSGLRVSSDPQKVLKFVKRSSQPSKSSEVHKRYSRRPQSPQRVINVLKILWSSNFLTRSSNGPNKVFKRFLWKELKRSTRIHQKFLNGSSTFWEHQVLRSTKSPQKVHKVLKKSRNCTKGTQDPQASASQLILKMSSNSSKVLQSPRSPQRSTKGIQDDLKVLKMLSTSSISCCRQTFLKWSSNGLHNGLRSY